MGEGLSTRRKIEVSEEITAILEMIGGFERRIHENDCIVQGKRFISEFPGQREKAGRRIELQKRSIKRLEKRIANKLELLK